jgi:glycosyltransferase involved in cell wall biosynthesis
VVFSRFEKELYAGYFGIDPERIRFLPWAMDPPVPGPENPVSGDYVCAVGGEARDYALLARAMARLPEIRAVIVARPSSLAGIDLPGNVTAFTNLPAPQTWRIAADSLGMVVPLRTDRTACGHITMVGAQLLGLPLVITRSAGIADYAREGENAVLVPAGDEDALAAAVSRLAGDRAAMRELGRRARGIAARENALAGWVEYFRDLPARL